MEITLINLILLFIIGFIAATISGAAGFGGALLLLPVLNLTVGTILAVPTLTVAQLIGNLSRVIIGFKQIRWKPVIYFIIGAFPLTMVGAYSFVVVDKSIIVRLIGIFIIVFVIIKYFKLSLLKNSNIKIITGGAITGFLSGLIGSAGPIGAAFFLSLDLSPVSYVASEAVTAVFMHITKLVVYQGFLKIGYNAILIGGFIGISMILGTWVSKKIIEKIPKDKFQIFVSILLIGISIYMIISG